jgi:hypothetical protein
LPLLLRCKYAHASKNSQFLAQVTNPQVFVNAS